MKSTVSPKGMGWPYSHAVPRKAVIHKSRQTNMPMLGERISKIPFPQGQLYLIRPWKWNMYSTQGLRDSGYHMLRFHPEPKLSAALQLGTSKGQLQPVSSLEKKPQDGLWSTEGQTWTGKAGWFLSSIKTKDSGEPEGRVPNASEMVVNPGCEEHVRTWGGVAVEDSSADQGLGPINHESRRCSACVEERAQQIVPITGTLLGIHAWPWFLEVGTGP